MVTMTASINAGDVARFNSALKEYADVLGKDMATAPRRAAIQICKSLRAGTRVAPSRARPNEFSISKSNETPKYVSSRDGVKFNPPLRRVHVDRSKLTRIIENHAIPRKSFDVYARKGKMKSDVRNRLTLFHRGLAKQSWGWVMHNIFNGAAPAANWRRKRGQRDPIGAVGDSTSSSFVSELSASGYARISNRLDYIADALKISVDDAIVKATNWIVKQVERRRPKV